MWDSSLLIWRRATSVGIEFETLTLRFASCSDKLKVANDELQKKKAYIDSLEPKVSSSGKRVNFYSLKFSTSSFFGTFFWCVKFVLFLVSVFDCKSLYWISFISVRSLKWKLQILWWDSLCCSVQASANLKSVDETLVSYSFYEANQHSHVLSVVSQLKGFKGFYLYPVS